MLGIAEVIDECYADFHFYKGLEAIMTQLHAANAFIQRHKPWMLTKSTNDTDIVWLQTIVAVALETLRVAGILLQPVTPLVADRLLQRLNVSQDERTFDHASRSMLGSRRDGKHIILGQLTGVLVARIQGK